MDLIRARLAAQAASARPRRRSTSCTASTRTRRACSASPRRASPSARCTQVFQRHTAAPRLPGRRGGRGRRDAHRIAPGRRSRRRHPRLDPPHRPGPARRHVRGAACAACAKRDARAASASRPGARTRSASTSPNAATRSSAKRSTFATCFAPVASPFPRPRLMLHAAPLGFPHPVTGVALDWTAPPPADFVAVLESLGGSRGDL